MNKVELQGKLESVDKLTKTLLMSMQEQELSVGVSACLSIAVAAMASEGITEESAVKYITVVVGLLYADRVNEAANSTKH